MRRLLLVLGALWRVSSWIPFVRISIHVRVEMDIASGIRDESAGGMTSLPLPVGMPLLLMFRLKAVPRRFSRKESRRHMSMIGNSASHASMGTPSS